jgi:hypothetical protein
MPRLAAKDDLTGMTARVPKISAAGHDLVAEKRKIYASTQSRSLSNGRPNGPNGLELPKNLSLDRRIYKDGCLRDLCAIASQLAGKMYGN